MPKENKKTPSPDVKSGIFTGDDTAEFFQSLEDDSSPNQETSTNSQSNSGEGSGVKEKETVEQQVASLKDEIHNVSKRYGDSSSEAIKLKTELNELKPYMPIFDEMKQNPNLVDGMKKLIKQGQAPLSPQEALGLGDDFIFDSEEAIKDINSDSAKVMRYMARVESGIQSKREEGVRIQRERAHKNEQDFQSFTKESKLTKDDVSALKEYMATHKLNHEDIYFLMKRKDIAKNIAEKAREETVKQIRNANELNGDSLGNRSSVLLDTTDDDKFFDRVFGEREKGLFG